MKQSVKDWIQYGTAIAMIVSAIALSFISFILLMEVHTTVLVYVSEALTYAASIFGVSIYFNHKLAEVNDRIKRLGGGEEREISEQLQRLHKETEAIEEEEPINENEINNNNNIYNLQNNEKVS